MTYVTTSSMMFDVSNNLFLQFPSRLCQLVRRNRASDISRGRGPAKFRYFREIPRNTAKSARNISKYMSAKHI